MLRQAGLVGKTLSLADAGSKIKREDEQHEILSTNSRETSESYNVELVRMPLPRELSSVTEQEKQHIVLQRMEREEEKKKEANRREKLLEEIQNIIAIGNYAEAFATIDREEINFVGSSDENATFFLDVIFYKLVALMEEAFVCNEFNSAEQHKCIIESLKLSNVS